MVSLSSDAAVEAYEGWARLRLVQGGTRPPDGRPRRGAAGAAVYAFDPGDMRTDMHQRAFPGEDISDRPEPETVVPALLDLLARAALERPVPRRGPAAGVAA